MWFRDRKTGHDGRAFLARLAQDTRANTLAIMTMALIPLAGLVGGGLDISRMYIVKTRLQHACDAGALAGRKAMGGGTWAQNGNAPNARAIEFFDANFATGSYGSYERTRSFAENAGKVTGTASAKLPMTLMKIFKQGDETLTVTCTADMRLPNTDVMFVLDITGSMNSMQPGDSVSKLDALKTSVKCFYEIVARLDTDANCTTGAPSGGTGSQVQIRFGFVPYATNVNVGKLLKPEWFADNWNYQTRRPRWWIRIGNPSSTSKSVNAPTAQDQCTQANADQAPFSTDTSTYSNNDKNRTRTIRKTTVTSWSNGVCYGTETTTVINYVWRENVYGDASKDDWIGWNYNQLTVDVSPLKNGTAWNSSFQLPIGPNGAARTVTWDGCVEERRTIRTKDFDPIPNNARDLDLDSVPVQGQPATLWAPVLDDLTFTRWDQSTNTLTRNEVLTKNDLGNFSYYDCKTEARKLATWTDPSAFSGYVDGLQGGGNTYHDIGLIWGARLMSPTGLFGSENAFTPQGGEIERHMIFMTDGDACTSELNYQAYGVAWYDRRQTPEADAPSSGCISNAATLTEQVNLRTEALCKAIRNKNITLWVIAFGNLHAETETRLSNCATPGRYFKATSAAALQSTFKSIADQISSLRLTQ